MGTARRNNADASRHEGTAYLVGQALRLSPSSLLTSLNGEHLPPSTILQEHRSPRMSETGATPVLRHRRTPLFQIPLVLFQESRVLGHHRFPVWAGIRLNKLKGCPETPGEFLRRNPLTQLTGAWAASHREVNRNHDPRLLREPVRR